MDVYDDDYIEGVAPCEFCGEPFPLMELILHQTSHLAEDDVYEYPLFDDYVDAKQLENPVSHLEEIVVEPKVNIEEKEIQKYDSKKEPKVNIEEKEIQKYDSKKEPKIAFEEKQTLSFDKKVEKSEVKTLRDEKRTDFSTKSGEKLPIYGTVQDLEEEKEVYKMPSNPVLSTKYKEKDEEDINNLSDDDSSESLEEFWIRAREFLKRNRVKNEC